MLLEKIESKIRITRYGYPFILFGFFLNLLFLLAGVKSLVFISFLYTVFAVFFFRDPEREIPQDDSILISPADGTVLKIESLDTSQYEDVPCTKVSIFMSVFNVHVNRIPYSGMVKDVRYFPGKFFNASFDKASLDNERNAVLIETETGKSFWTVQIAGLIARRIVCNIVPGMKVSKGDRFGMIRFGSRLELYLPIDSEIFVKPGDKVSAGSSLICKF